MSRESIQERGSASTEIAGSTRIALALARAPHEVPFADRLADDDRMLAILREHA